MFKRLFNFIRRLFARNSFITSIRIISYSRLDEKTEMELLMKVRRATWKRATP